MQPATEVSSGPGRSSLDAESSAILNWPSWIHHRHRSPLGLQPSPSGPSYLSERKAAGHEPGRKQMSGFLTEQNCPRLEASPGRGKAFLRGFSLNKVLGHDCR